MALFPLPWRQWRLRLRAWYQERLLRRLMLGMIGYILAEIRKQGFDLDEGEEERISTLFLQWIQGEGDHWGKLILDGKAMHVAQAFLTLEPWEGCTNAARDFERLKLKRRVRR